MSLKSDIKVELRKTFRSSDMDTGFAEEIMRHPGGERLKDCYQCGVCSGGCPVGKITSSYQPRQIVRMAILGLKKEVLSSDSIWLCSSCFTCQERCPQEVEVADIMLVLRNLATRDGFVSKLFVDQAQFLIENGKLVRHSGYMDKQRQALGLPKLHPPSKDAVRMIVAATGFDKLIEKLRGD
jgi:heterodisulfide reductase subunit C